MFVARDNCTLPNETVYRVFSLKNNLTYGPIIGGQVNDLCLDNNFVRVRFKLLKGFLI